MKNKLIIIIVFLYCYTPIPVDAQFVHNKVNVYGGFMLEKFHGKEFVQDGSFNYPALISNLKKSTGYTLKVLYKTRNNYSIGLQLELREGSDWKLSDWETYTGSSVIFSSISPTFQYHLPILKGWSKDIRGILELSPVFGTSQLTLSESIFEIQNGAPPLESNDNFYGMTAAIGVEFDITQTLGLTGNYSYQVNKISSELHSDEKFSSSRLSIGLFFKLIKDKRYFYL